MNEIFKAYDIRGIVPSTLNEEVALGLGRAFGTAARAEGQTTVAVGRDGRLSEGTGLPLSGPGEVVSVTVKSPCGASSMPSSASRPGSSAGAG